MSKVIPNTFMCFNVYIDRAMHQLTDSELRVLLFATRHILGWQDKIASRRGCISLSMFTGGFTTVNDDGTVTEYAGCGLGEIAVRAACNALCEFGFLVKVGEPTQKGQEWRLGETPNWKVLEARTAEREHKRKQQVEKATQAATAKRQGVTSNEPPTLNVGGVSSNVPTGVTSNVGEGVSSNEEQQSHDQSHDQSHELSRPRNAMFDAVSWAWRNSSGGYVGKLIAFLTGKCKPKDGKYHTHMIRNPMTPLEVVAFRLWRDYHELDMPKLPETIERLVEEFRGVPEYDRLLEAAAQHEIRHMPRQADAVPEFDAPDVPIARDVNSVLDGVLAQLGGG